MNDQLRPPTDNLYKFLALSGLALTVFAVYVEINAANKLRSLSAETDEAAIASNRIDDRYDDDIERIDRALDSKRIDAATATTRKTEARRKRDAAITKYDSAYDDAKAAERKFQKANFDQVIIMVVFAVLGLFLAAVGFFLWWFMLQRHLDVIMKYDVQERRIKAAESTKA